MAEEREREREGYYLCWRRFGESILDTGDVEKRDQRTLSISFGWDETKQPNSVQTGGTKMSPEDRNGGDAAANANGIVLVDAK